MYKKLNDFHKKFTGLKNVTPRTEDNKSLKTKVLKDAGDLYNNLYYIYKNKYNKEINNLDTKNRKMLHYKKLRLIDDYQYLSEEETSEKPTKTNFDELYEQIIKEEREINNDLFKKYFTIYQSPSNMYDFLNKIKNIKEKDIQVKLIKSELTDLKKDIGNTSKNDVNKIEEMNKIADILELILNFNNDDQQGEDLKILTPKQMLSRLPINVAQLKAGNNS